jgi:hypothetical protein
MFADRRLEVAAATKSAGAVFQRGPACWYERIAARLVLQTPEMLG